MNEQERAEAALELQALDELAEDVGSIRAYLKHRRRELRKQLARTRQPDGPIVTSGDLAKMIKEGIRLNPRS